MLASNILPPFNLLKWINTNQDKLKPPVCNKVVYQDHNFILMVVGGPNQRKDFHINQGAEIFYQLKGSMLLKILDSDNFIRAIPIEEGEIFQLPPNVPHSPQRFKDTIGLVVECTRQKNQLDTLLWLCDNCNNRMYSEDFYLENVETDFAPVFARQKEYINNHCCQYCTTTTDYNPESQRVESVYE